MNRREFLPLAAAGLLSGYAGYRGGKQDGPQRDARTSVTLRRTLSYEEDLAAIVLDGLAGLDVHGKRVLLKPELVDLEGCVSAHVSVVAAAFAAFQELGAAEVRIGEAPELHRDTWALAEAAGYRRRIPNFDDVFVDMNGDDVSPVEGIDGRKEIYLPVSALRADLVVSIAKMKTDARYGASLSMLNLFGVIPGAIYGWPTERVQGITGAKKATELARIFRRGFAIVDGIWGIEGRGDLKQAGVLAMGSDLAAVDATCCRVMGLDPEKIEHLKLAANRQGVIEEARIEQRGDSIEALKTPFRPA